MVGGTPKPFACTHEGCNMTFTNEDHLNVHRKKHDMDLNLNLGTKPNTYGKSKSYNKTTKTLTTIILQLIKPQHRRVFYEIVKKSDYSKIYKTSIRLKRIFGKRSSWGKSVHSPKPITQQMTLSIPLTCF